MKSSILAGAIAFGVLGCLAAPAWAQTSFLDFIYVEGQTVETFAVPTPPDVVSSAGAGGSLQSTVVATFGGTLDGQNYLFGDLSLFDNIYYSNAQPTLHSGFEIASPGTKAVGSNPMFAGRGSAPQILPGVYNLVDTSNDAHGTLYIVQPEPLVFTLSGSVNAVMNIEDYPREISYGTKYIGYGPTQYIQTFPILGTLNGAAYNFGDVYFYGQNGGFSTQNGGLDFGSFFQNLGSPDLFTGPLYAPTFKLGTFQLIGGETLTITAPDGPPPSLDIASAAPEPSAWLLMMAGVGGIGLLLRRAKTAPRSLFEGQGPV